MAHEDRRECGECLVLLGIVEEWCTVDLDQHDRAAEFLGGEPALVQGPDVTPGVPLDVDVPTLRAGTMVDLAPLLLNDVDTRDGDVLWERSGLAALTGRRWGPTLGGPKGVVPGMGTLAAHLGVLSDRLGRRVEVDGVDLLLERARITGHSRQGDLSVGGACRLIQSADGWIALSLARDDDLAAVPAWLECDIDALNATAVETVVRARSTDWLIGRAALLGLPCGALGEVTHPRVTATRIGAGAPVPRAADLTVVDLSSLWAGPLCGRLLAEAGMRVVKVESSRRPDGARLGPAAFFSLMNDRKEHVALNLAAEDGREQLRRLVAEADVVIEASRPRALEQMGIVASESAARVWLSITGYGRSMPDRVGFGDDAAVAGGLVAWDPNGPVFAGDAIADPIAGLFGTVVVLDRLQAGDRWLVDLPLAHVAALLVQL